MSIVITSTSPGAAPVLMARAAAAAWPQARAALRSAVGADAYDAWLGSLHLEALRGGTAHLTVPTRFLRTWIEQHHRDVILAALRKAGFAVDRVEIALRSVAIVTPARCRPHAGGGVPVGAPSADLPQSGVTAPVVVSSPLDGRMTFDTFAVGAANRLAHAAVRSVVEGRGEFLLLVVHGETGLGKTHLLQAAGHALAPGALYISAEQLRFSHDAASRAVPAAVWRSALVEAPVLMLDDLHILVRAGRALPAEVVHILDQRSFRALPTVVAVDLPVGKMEGEERLLSRLKGGLDVGLGLPEEALRRDIVITKLAAIAERHAGFVLPADVIDLLVTAIAKSPRDLEGALARLLLHRGADGAAPDLAAAERAIGDLVGVRRPNPSIETIQRVVGRRYHVTPLDIRSARRTANLVKPRQVAMWLAKTMTLRSLPEIGRRFGGRDHTTVLHAFRKIERLRDDDEELAAELQSLAQAIEREA
ncbi:helix-turn-helix domain-containing protein [Rhodoplanes roseus]|uniref:Chromosomal replication initiator protein DnaA n=1 Tax=Rhodoplanes roseus TaxID=29409 RepID=A0A327KUR1_9BRAD|nr:DnaA/Hda family protein [Rhodoplanes roseus]RAI42650.1 hypothetical protein CH341_18495 [Rhodoplanes roseus]